MTYSRQTDLIAIATTGLEIVLLNSQLGLSTVRKFTRAAENKITDVGFSHDGRWLLVASLDRSVRIWDIVTSELIDWLRFEQAVLSLDMSPSGEFLATTHVG